MSCFLKITYNNRHKKYRYCKDKLINFNQIRNELSINLQPHLLRYEVETGEQTNQVKDSSSAIKLKEEELADYLKNGTFKAN